MKGGIRKRNNKYYYYFSIKINGKWKKIERKGGTTKKEAEKALREAISEYEGTGTVKDVSEISYCDYLDFWYKNYVEINIKYNTKVEYQNTINNHLKPYFEKYKLKAISPDILQEFINKKYKDGYSKSAVAQQFSVLSRSFKAAVHPYQYIKDNPMQYVKMPKYNSDNFSKKIKESEKVLQHKDYERILNRFSNNPGYTILLQIAYHTGARAGEVCGLTWDNIDLENKTINIEKNIVMQDAGMITFGTLKTNSSARQIKIGDTLCTLLKKWKIAQKENMLKYGEYYTYYKLESNKVVPIYDNVKLDVALVCTRENGKAVTPYSVKYISRVIKQDLSIDFNFHMIRHTHATKLIEAGANYKDVQRRLGHSQLSTTMDTYSHITNKMSDDTVALFEKAINIKN